VCLAPKLIWTIKGQLAHHQLSTPYPVRPLDLSSDFTLNGNFTTRKPALFLQVPSKEMLSKEMLAI